MDVVESLTELGLTSREAKIYAALLEMGQASPLQLANKTGLKRPTVYLDLESLRRKKLAGLTFKGKKTVYAPDAPSRILQRIQQQERAAKELLPYLRALENKGGTKPQIRYYDDPKDIKRVWLDETYNATENLYISHYVETLNLFPELEAEANNRMKKGIIKVMREIHPYTPESIAFSNQKHLPGREFRIMPKGMTFDVDWSIWNDSVALYSNPNRYLLVITDKSLTQGFRAMFEAAWMVSSDPKTLTPVRRQPRAQSHPAQPSRRQFGSAVPANPA